LSFPHSLRVKVLERVDCLRWSWQLLFSNLLEMLFSTSMFSEKSIVDADLSTFDFELVGGLGLGSPSVGVDDGLGHLLNPGSLGAHHVNIVLGVLGVGEGSGASFLLLHITSFYMCNFYSSFHTINKLLLRREQKSGQASSVQVSR
jgi:hypothetical protein